MTSPSFREDVDADHHLRRVHWHRHRDWEGINPDALVAFWAYREGAWPHISQGPLSSLTTTRWFAAPSLVSSGRSSTP